MQDIQGGPLVSPRIRLGGGGGGGTPGRFNGIQRGEGESCRRDTRGRHTSYRYTLAADTGGNYRRVGALGTHISCRHAGLVLASRAAYNRGTWANV